MVGKVTRMDRLQKQLSFTLNLSHSNGKIGLIIILMVDVAIKTNGLT
jgi:hypothetical protein